ncbi:Aromatic amino acid aminotransferase [Smittium culicis]|uniref:Aromatic amino acid aminotransferase n=2 Tax=Smittium culicis TaxID=133412 RepID=A0A1R1XT04_9FUNG|nr:Aromatic amino acid aminotransferase [Smittium culicis]
MTNYSTPIDLSPYFTERANRRNVSPLKGLLRFMQADPTLISLGGGLPNPDLFPFIDVSATVVLPGNNAINIAEGEEKGLNITLTRSSRHGSKVEPLNSLLQYGGGFGIKSLVDFFTEHMTATHNPKYKDWSVVSSVGSTDGLTKVIELFLNDGDNILVCEWTYPTAIETFHSSGINRVPVKIDGEGMIPSALDEVCSNWSGEKPLRMVYLIPTGQNPSGATMSLQRRKDFYKVCQKHNLIVIEDDPYYFLQFADAPVCDTKQATENTFSELPGIERLIPSLLSLDTDGRIIRLDTVSKLLAPNMRLGWITGQSNLIQKIQFHNETTIQQPCGFTQGLASKLFNDTWGLDGFLTHVLSLQKEYLVRRNVIVSQLQKHLGNMVKYTIPTGGMFVWMELNLSPDQLAQTGIMQRIFDKMIEESVLLVPGWMFSPASDPSSVKDKPFLRAAFSFASVEEFEGAVTRLAKVLESFGLHK